MLMTLKVPTKMFPQSMDDINVEKGDMYIGTEVQLPIGGVQKMGTTKRPARDADGQITGIQHHNPVLDT